MTVTAPRRNRDAAPGRHSETARQLVHMAMGGFALTLRWLTWWQAAALAAGALAFNLLVLPRLASGLYRPGDHARGVHGIVLYPLAVLMLVLLFPRRADIVAAAWGILAVGDGIATIVGRAVGGPRWSWNREKTLAGTAAFCLAGAAAGVALAWWCRGAAGGQSSLAFVVIAPIVAAVAAAAVETLPVRLDDNISVPAAAAAVLWLSSSFGVAPVSAASTAALRLLPVACGVNALVAWAGYRARTVSLSGAIAGAVIGVSIFVTLGWRGWLLLLIVFVAASAASRLGLERKRLLGIAEDRGGRRGAGNAIANTGVAAIAALLAVAGTSPDAARLAFAAALTAGGSDTIASEIGKAWGRRTWSVTSFSQVPPGRSGAMSIEGTAAGLVGALGLATIAVALGIAGPPAIAPIVLAAAGGSLIESYLGATLEAPGILNNDMLNFLNTAAAAALAIVLATFVP